MVKWNDEQLNKTIKDISKKIVKRVEKEINKAEKKIKTDLEKKQERIRSFRREASRLVSMANKRLIRLEANKLTDTPAYQKLVNIMGDKPRFSIRGKDYNEVQREVARMRQFLNAKTSTVRGANQVLKEMAKNTGIKYKNLSELRKSAGKFFELASKVEQYLRTVDDMASAIGYQKIWEAINQYVQKERVDLSKSSQDINAMVDRVIKAMDIYQEQERYYSNNNGVKIDVWYKLDDE